jgi:4-amino-4-deoxy-L-arabinose transferase-like glycosyltransferase
LAAGLIAAAVLSATLPAASMVWDEGDAILRADAVSAWFALWTAPPVDPNDRPWSEDVIAAHWRFTIYREGHPAGYAVLVALGRALGGWFLGPLAAARLGPILFFGVAAAATFRRLEVLWNRLAACGALAAMLLLPRLFAHLHYASYDGPLCSAWLLAWAAFAPARRSRIGAVAWGITLGLAMSIKATGWILPLPFLLWAALYRDRAAGRAALWAVPAALGTFLLLNPPLWHSPIAGLTTFFQLNLNRAAQPGLNIATLFLGRLYNLDHPLPWYNTLFWTFVTVPLPLLLLAVVGLGRALRRGRAQPQGLLVVLLWAVLLVVRAVPGTPPHDGVRLFLPSFVFLAILAGLGTAWLFGRLLTVGRRRAILLVGLAYFCSATSLLWYAPHWLSYYNLLIGGLPGAAVAGMEPTYYWDALDDDVLRWLHAHTPAGNAIRFSAGPSKNLRLMRTWGWLRRPLATDDGQPFLWYVLQFRPSAHQPVDRWLIDHAEPAYIHRIGNRGFGPWRVDQPLLAVYHGAEVRAARRAIASGVSARPQERPFHPEPRLSRPPAPAPTGFGRNRRF